MIDHRRLQRTLFRMQCDARFAERLRDAEPAAVASTGLGAAELALLREPTPASLRADPKDTRKLQVLGNLATEYVLTIAAASAAGVDDFLEAFLAADEFHAAMAAGERLPFAFGSYATRRTPEVASDAYGGLVALECALVRVRRAPQVAPSLAPEDVQLAPGSELVRLVAGLAAHADALRAKLDAGAPPPSFRALQGSELVLVAPRPPKHEFALAEVHVEALQPPVDQVLERAVQPLSPTDRSELAGHLGASTADLEAFVADLVQDGILVTG